MIYINPTKIQGLTTLQMIQISNESPESLAKKKMNQDLKDLSQWLKASKLSLNVKKTDLIIFTLKTLD